MRIDSLRVSGDRLLNSMEMDFCKEYPLTVLLGGNGSGKSILLESLVRVFIALEDAEAPEFEFDIRYVCNGYEVMAAFDQDGKFSCKVRASRSDTSYVVSLDEFREKGAIYLPNFVFGYHSGRNERLKRLFTQRDRKYFEAINKDEKAIREGKDDATTGQRSAFRRFRYITADHMALGALALLLNASSAATEIKRDVLHLGELESVLLTFKRPSTARDADFFWGAPDEYAEFLTTLVSAAWMPLRSTTPEWMEAPRRGRQLERLHLQLPDARAVHRLVEQVGSAKYLINRLDQLLALGLLERVSVRMKHRGTISIPSEQLSEGEQQFMTVLGAVLSSERSESLHLFDEPDSHLNPRWAHDYVHHLTSAFRAANPESPAESDLTHTGDALAFGTDQVILATHNPLTIGPLTREQVRILERTPTGIQADLPKYDPKGVGADGLLKMDLFGLRSTLDSEVMSWIDKYYSMAGSADLSPAEQKLKSDLERKLNRLGINYTHPNPYFEEFARQMSLEMRNSNYKNSMSQEDLNRSAEISKRIFESVVGTKK